MTDSSLPEVSQTAVWFLIGIGIVTIFLIIFYLYFTKKLCFKKFSGCDNILESNYNSAKKALAQSYDESDSESSSDSDEETYRNFQKAMQKSNASLLRSSNAIRTLDVQDVDAETKLSSSQNNIATTSANSSSRAELSQVDELSPNKENEIKNKLVRTSSVIACSPTVDDFDLALDEASVYSKDVYSLLEEDEITAAIQVKPKDDVEGDESFEEPLPICPCGTLDMAFHYVFSDKKLQITILHANDLPSKERGGASIIQVRAVVLPSKRKRFKTKVQHVNSPRFRETFKLNKITPEDIPKLGLRLRMYGIGKVRDRLIGEATVRFDELNLMSDPKVTVTLQFEPRSDVNRSDLDSSLSLSLANDAPAASTLAHGGNLPELFISLSYNEMTGRLMVEVVKGSHFQSLTMSNPPDTCVKLVLLNSAQQEMAQSKTGIRRSQPNPIFKETFYFQVAQFQLPEVSLMASVYCYHTIKRKSMLGWILLGQNSSSDMEEQHWQEMKEAEGKAIGRWHTLIVS